MTIAGYLFFRPDEVSGRLQPENTELVASGAGIYSEHCASCHGKSLEGQPDWRKRKPDGKLPAPPHDETGHTWHHPDEVLIKVTKLGVAALAGPDYQTDMPAYNGILNDTEIIAVLSYIKSRWPKEIRKRHDQLSQSSQ